VSTSESVPVHGAIVDVPVNLPTGDIRSTMEHGSARPWEAVRVYAGTPVPAMNWFEVLDRSDKVKESTTRGGAEFKRAVASNDTVPKLNKAVRALTNVQQRSVFVAAYDVLLARFSSTQTRPSSLMRY
jgi:hypothetical protein